MKISSLKMYLSHPVRFLTRVGESSFMKKMSDERYLKMVFKDTMGYSLNLKEPRTFNEKLQWLKLYDRKPIYTDMVDKFGAKKYIADIVGEEYIIPTLGVWDSFDEIDFDLLPDQFVLKCTHDSGGLIICGDKSKLNKSAAKEKIEKCLKRNYYWSSREWPYKNVPPRIIAEAYLGENLQDYRIYCFNGEPKLVYSYGNESNEVGNKPEPATCDILDDKWERMPFRQKSPPSENLPVKPAHFDEMLKISKILARDVPFLRVDFYDTTKMYIGKLTFYPGSGISKFYPNEWDEKLGEWIKLPEKKTENEK